MAHETSSAIELAWNNVQLQGEKHGFRGSDRAGACFSPDGTWLFANLQSPGSTFANRGSREWLGG